MSTRDQLIQFQNKAELDFEKEKTIGTSFRYLLAFIIFVSSTLAAFFTLPFRHLIKMFLNEAPVNNFLSAGNKNIDSILSKENLVLLDFWAEWCGPCIMMDPSLKALARSSKKICIAKINADKNSLLMKKFKIKGIPQLILIKDGSVIKRHAGAMSLQELETFCFEHA